jgi:NAD(P)-dependent dehydrogenase (short-subunit alcohol dehydrogenase family)
VLNGLRNASNEPHTITPHAQENAMTHLFNLKGKVALVTGGSGLLGDSFCQALSSAGASVVVADIDISRCDDVAYDLSNDSMALRVDVCDVASLLSARSKIIERYGRLDILINNAAINDAVENGDAQLELSKFEAYPLALWNRVMHVNVTGVFLCSQVLGELMKENGGSIINIASTYGLVAPDQSLYHDGVEQRFYKSPIYPTSKAAVIGFTRYLSSYWAKHKIRVNALCPGGVQNHQENDFIENYNERVPIGRMAVPNDFSGAIVFLASDASSYMTGANLVVDGGWTVI